MKIQTVRYMEKASPLVILLLRDTTINHVIYCYLYLYTYIHTYIYISKIIHYIDAFVIFYFSLTQSYINSII